MTSKESDTISQLPLVDSLRDDSQPAVMLLIAGTKQGGYKIQSSNDKVGFAVIRSYKDPEDIKALFKHLRKNGMPSSYLPIRMHYPLVMTKNKDNLSNADYQNESMRNIFCHLEDVDGKMKKVSRTSFDDIKDEDSSGKQCIDRGSPEDRILAARDRLKKKAKELGYKSKLSEKHQVVEFEDIHNDDWWKSSAPSSSSSRADEADDDPFVAKPADQMQDKLPGEELKIFSIADKARELVDAGILTDHRAASVSNRDIPVSDIADISDKDKWISTKAVESKKSHKSDRLDDLFHLPKKFRKVEEEREKMCLVQFISNDTKGVPLEEPIIIIRGCFDDKSKMLAYKDKFAKRMLRRYPNRFVTHLDLVEVPMNVLGSPWYKPSSTSNVADDTTLDQNDKQEAKELREIMEQSLVVEEARKDGRMEPIDEPTAANIVHKTEVDISIKDAAAAAAAASTSVRSERNGISTRITPHKPAPPVKRGIKSDVKSEVKSMPDPIVTPLKVPTTTTTTTAPTTTTAATSDGDDDDYGNDDDYDDDGECDLPAHLRGGRTFTASQLLHKK